MLKKEFYRFLSHITAGSVRKKYRKKYKSTLSERDLLNKIIQNLELDIVHELEHHKAQLAELQNKANDAEFRQSLFFDYFLDPAQARPATGQLAERQNTNLYLLKTFISLCKKHHLDYWIDFGTLLGAIRHKGCIPWDDDMDVSMKREDIEKLKQFASTELDDELFLWDIKAEPFFRLQFKDPTRKEFLDIFPYKKTKNGWQIEQDFPIPSYKKPVADNILFPLKSISFLGNKVKIPNNTLQYLQLRYGNWQLLPKKAHPIKH